MLSVKIIFVVLSLNMAFVVGTNQHLICKTVDDVFTDGPANTPNTPRVLHGPAGKRGQKGVKGEPGLPGSKGENGLPGLVDPQNVQNVIEEKMEEANRELFKRIETLEELVANLTVGFNCLEGVVYKEKCYFAIFHDDQDVPYQDINGLCSGKGGKPADLLNREHQDVIVDYIRRKRTERTDVFLGMTYLLSTSTMVWSSGEKVPADVAGALLWWPSYPRPKWNYDKMILGVDSTTGIYNYRSTFDRHGVLCQK